MRRLVFLVVLLTACRSNAPVQRTSPSPSPTQPRFATVDGYVTTNYLMPSGECKDLSTGGPGVHIEAGLARGLIEKTEGREVQVRDETGSVVATATTDSPAELVSAKVVDEPGENLETCLAGAPYRLQLPTASDSFVFSLPGVPGSPPSISITELQARDLKCDLHILIGNKLFDEKCVWWGKLGGDFIALKGMVSP